MSDHSYNHQLVQLITQDFKIEADEMLKADSEEVLLDQLNKLVSFLLDKDMEKLLQTLYRVDVNETLVKTILATSEPTRVSKDLSSAILERLKKKLYYRNKYR